METPATTVESQGGSTATVEAPATEVSQSDYINDAFSDYFVDPTEDKTTTQAEEPKTDDKTKAQPPKDENTEGKTPNGGEKTPPKPEDKPDPFTSAFVNGETGDFDLEKLTGISFEGINFQGEDKPAEPGGQSAKSDIPEWKQAYEADKVFKQNIHNSRLGPIESVFNQVQQSQIPDEYKDIVLSALRQEYAKVQQENEQFFRERDEQNAYRKRQDELEAIREETRSSKLPELARTNATAIISKLPGDDSKAKIDLYNRIMFGPGAGGELLEDMFQVRYPDFQKKPKAEQDRMKFCFVNELQADGGRLQRHFNRAYRYLIADPENLKKIMGQVSRNTDANNRSNAAAAQKSPTGSVARQPQAGTSKWDGYFADPEGAKIRI